MRGSEESERKPDGPSKGRYHSDAGTTYIVSEGRLRGHEGFKPNRLPVEAIDSNEFMQAHSNADRLIERFNNRVDELYHSDTLTTYLAVYEASHSSKIEGVEQDVRDYYYDRENPEVAPRAEEVQQYLDAIDHLGNELKREGELSTDSLKRAHRILMENSEDYTEDSFVDSEPGEFRRNSMLVGDSGELRRGDDGEFYIAPPDEDVAAYFKNWVDSFNEDPTHSVLIDSLLLHAQFEMIHGFADGNGRMGRLLVSAYLRHRERIDPPTFGWSRVLEAKQSEYFKRLYDISHFNQWNEWIEFGLGSMDRAAERAVALLEEADERVKNDKMRIREELNRSKYDEDIFNYIIHQPVVSVTGIAESLEVNKTVVQNRLEQYRKIDLIRPGREEDRTTAGKPRKYYEYSDFLDLFDHDFPVSNHGQ